MNMLGIEREKKLFSETKFCEGGMFTEVDSCVNLWDLSSHLPGKAPDAEHRPDMQHQTNKPGKQQPGRPELATQDKFEVM